MSLALMCTERDVIDRIPQLYESGASSEYPVRSLAQIRRTIYQTDGQLRSMLRVLYGATLTITSWADVPEPKDVNTGTGSLTEATASAAAITELWTLTFSSSTAFSASGALSGSQGTGSTSTAFASTNGNLSIAAANWAGTPASGDIFFIRIFAVEPTLVDISACLAAISILRSVYGAEIPNSSDLAEQYEAYLWGAEKKPGILRLLLDPTASGTVLQKGLSARNLSPIQVDWEISDEGEDVTNYATKEWDSVE